MTKRPNEKNERLKREYLYYRKHARQVAAAARAAEAERDMSRRCVGEL